jgi:UDP-N-acetylmuramyl pentapeptide phosphotransferase/UDP-N-acetylglucosamine-1-phosphate transferase
MRDSARFAIAHAQAPELLVTVYLRYSYFFFTCYLTSFCPTSFDLMALCIVHTAGAIFFACGLIDDIFSSSAKNKALENSINRF